jgi:outer membrane protein assembly factor BamD (BamD/ComL family)
LAPNHGRSLAEPAAVRSKDEGLAAERNLIEMARTALARGRIDGALATLHRHARRFAKGQLAEERDSLFVQTLVAKGDFAQARERATRFRRQHPSSLFQPAVDQALQSIP